VFNGLDSVPGWLRNTEKSMFGNCYHFALETFFDLHSSLSSGTVTVGNSWGAFEIGSASPPQFDLPQLGDRPALVHGFVLGEAGALKDRKFGHAWLEGNGYVVDCGSAHKEHSLVRRDEYYQFWRINPAECHYYSIQQATEHLLRTGSISGWHDAPADAIVVEIRSAPGAQQFPIPGIARPALRA
jgi:hypothetical protein